MTSQVLIEQLLYAQPHARCYEDMKKVRICTQDLRLEGSEEVST